MERNTVQKKVIYDALVELDDHPTADEVYLLVRKSYPAISKATVYRNLGQMAETGKIKRIAVGDGADHFDHRTHDHLHFHCDVCSRIFDMEGSDEISRSIVLPKNGKDEIYGYNILFYGRCQYCRMSSK
ncbi:MAG: transcriptional repressor [Clostridia bacterium]|nr:transcriptional repressor [Clostridia bacterium]